MSNYAFSYYGEPNFESREAGAEYQAKWRAWTGSLGDALVSVTPLGMPSVVNSKGVSVSNQDKSKRLTGFSIVKAKTMDAAVEMAQQCPHAKHGTIEVSEVMDMGM